MTNGESDNRMEAKRLLRTPVLRWVDVNVKAEAGRRQVRRLAQDRGDGGTTGGLCPAVGEVDDDDDK